MPSKDVEAFKEWLEETGRSALTVQVYVAMLTLGEKGLRNPDLAPKTRHTIRAALRAWAEYSEDEALSRRLDKFPLPTARRQYPKPPFTTNDWKRLREAIRGLEPTPTALACGIMVDRGLRVGDVLRMKRSDIETGLATGTLAFTAKQGKRLHYRVKRITVYLEGLLAFKGWKQVGDLMVPRAGDKARAGRQRVSRLLKSLAKNLGIDPKYTHPHRLRRTYAVEFLKALGPDPRALPKLMAHMQWESIQTAMEYVGYVSDEELAKIEDQLD